MADDNLFCNNIKSAYYSATTAEIYDGMNWYNRANDACRCIATKYNLPLVTVAAVVAVISPRLPWGRNINLAEKLIASHCSGLDPMLVSGLLTASKAKACRILSGENPNTVLGGFKVVSFFNNLQLIENYVTIDTHAISIALGERANEKIAQSIFKSEKQYAAMANCYQIVAKELGIEAYQLQAITWTAWRRIHEIDKRYDK